MLHSFRAAGFAAAAMIFAVSTAFADPSMAWELEAAPISSVPEAWSAQSQILPEPSITASLGRTIEGLHDPVAVPEIATAPDKPAQDKPRTLREMVNAYASSDTLDNEHECLARAVYFESKGEPLDGQLAVAEVVINRARSGRFPSTLCGVVKQHRQFSFVRGGRIPEAPRAGKAWRTAVAVANVARQDLADSAGSSAMFFHARYVSPRWPGLKRIAAVGNHIFYR
jgi:spore germination cell wall hydrolase CwlJ-like protein